jgi:hypothetical protein
MERRHSRPGPGFVIGSRSYVSSELAGNGGLAWRNREGVPGGEREAKAEVEVIAEGEAREGEETPRKR